MNDHTNIGSLCSTAQCEAGRAQRTAMRWVDTDGRTTDYTFERLDTSSNRVANAFDALGVSPGSVVTLLLPKTPEYFAIALGLLKSEHVVCPLFSNFGKAALHERLQDSNARVLITKTGLYRRSQNLLDELPDLTHVILIDADEHLSDTVLSYPRLIDPQPTTRSVPHTNPASPALLHYTSGSTGRPKGVQHVHGAVAHHRHSLNAVLQPGPNDIYWCTADQGWVTGISYGIIAPWSEGITQVQYAGVFDPRGWVRVLQEQAVSIWYTAPTALRMMMQAADDIGSPELPALQRIYSVGEPLNPEIMTWCESVFGCNVYDTWFQTETGGIMIANRPDLPVKAGSMGQPVAGIRASVRTDDFRAEVPVGMVGKLCVARGWPSMFVAYRHMPEAYQSKFHNGWYDSGDLARQDDDGYFWFVGRADDVINTSGHLVGPFEVESALLELPEIIDVAVVGVPDPLVHEKIVAFVTLKPGVSWTSKLALRARIHVSNQLSPLAAPAEYYVRDNIPKNRSGKIMRRILRAQYLNEDVGDTSTLELM